MSERSPYAPAPMHDEIPDDEADALLDRDDGHTELDFREKATGWLDDDYLTEDDDFEDDDYFTDDAA